MAGRVVATTKAPEAKQKCSNICNKKPGFNSSGCPTEILLNLQRTAGNQAVQKLIKSAAFQKKQRTSQFNDICEEEVDRESGQVINILEPDSQRKLQKDQDIKKQKSEIISEKPPINKPELEIEEKKPIKEVTTEVKSTPETSGESKILSELPGENLPGTAISPAASRTAVAPKEIPKENAEVKIEGPEEGKELEETIILEEIAVKEVPISPENDPGFQKVVQHTKKIAAKEKAHASAKVKSAEIQAAAVGPSNEVASKAAAGQVQEMDQAAPKPFDGALFKAALIIKIESITPKNLKEADELKESGKVKSIKDDLTAQVVQSKERSQGEIKENVEKPPDKSGINPKSVTPLPPAEAGSTPKDINAAEAAPKPKNESEVSLQEGSKKLEQKMESASITDEMLENSNEPSFVAAVNAKKASQANAIEAPQAYRMEEQSALFTSQSEVSLAAQTQIEAMHASRQKQLTQVAVKQIDSKGKDEKKREEVANHIQEIYNITKEKVEAYLSKLDKDVDSLFDKGAVEAQAAFENYVDTRMKIYKQMRYSGSGGPLRWAHDKIFDLPDEVNLFYVEGRNLYIKMMNSVLDRIAESVETSLKAAKSEISNGKKEIEKYVDSLPTSLKSLGHETSKMIQNEFDNLEQNINEKHNLLIDSLANKYVGKVQQLDTRIKDMKAENRGLVNKAMTAIAGVAETITNLKNMLSNALSRAKDAVVLIIRDPIGFLGNLVAGVKLGFKNFVSKIDKYLLEGLMGWLFGALAEAGIQMPENFDLKGILSVVLQILGLTYQNIRTRAAKIVGEKVISTMERTAGIFQTLITKGPTAIWEEIKEKLGDFKSMILEPIKDFVISRIITAGVTWVLGLLNPVSAFIKAAKAIYDIIMFFVERASQVITLINAIVDSVISIAMGNITVAATKVEQALAKAVPVVIGLLAAILGLGGISEKIKSIIKKIQSPIEKAIDWMIEKAVKPLVMKTMKKGKELLEKGKAVLGLDIDKQVTLGKEKHTLRGHIEDDHVTILMSSSLMKEFHLQINAIETHQKKRLQELKQDKKAQHLSEKFEDLKKQATQISRTCMAAKNPHDREEIIEGGLNELEIKLGEIAIEFGFDQGVDVKEGDWIADLINKRRVKVRSIIVRDESGLLFGVDALYQGKSEFYSYGNFNKTWRKADLRDPGTKDNPFKLKWPKPASCDYPKLYFGGRTSTPISQKELQTRFENNQKDPNGVKIEKYYPHVGGILADGDKIGLTSRWYLDIDTKVGPLQATGAEANRTESGELNNMLKLYGFDLTKENMQVDHVHELQLGGEDDKGNLWPLDATINQSSGPTLARTTVEYPDGSGTVKMSELKQQNPHDFFFIITKVRKQ